MWIDVGLSALVSSRDEHRKLAASLTSASAALLLFYAAECGLKAALLSRRSLRNLSDLPEDLRTHDLRRLMKELSMPAGMSMGTYALVATPSGPARVETTDLHQAWRYGKRLEAVDHGTALQSLNSVLDWCETERR